MKEKFTFKEQEWEDKQDAFKGSRGLNKNSDSYFKCVAYSGESLAETRHRIRAKRIKFPKIANSGHNVLK